MRKKPKIVLLQDIIIPKGTVLTPAPRVTERHGNDHFGCTIGLSRNTAGNFTYHLDSDFIDELGDYFANLKE